MVVDVEAVVNDQQDTCDFLVGTITNPQNGLQLSLQLAFNAFIQEQLRWIEGFRPDVRYCGVLSPFRKPPKSSARFTRTEPPPHGTQPTHEGIRTPPRTGRPEPRLLLSALPRALPT